ncbi:MAG: RsmD family RNA methyltransferase [Planctomycetota bacterium]
MRIISGEFRRRKLFSPSDKSPARPMPDVVKEAVFNLLRGHTEGMAVLDLFAGSGAIGLEAVSRGASRCVLVERDRGTLAVLRKNIEHLGVEERAEAVSADALGPAVVSRCPRPVHLIFADPPYALVRDPNQWARMTQQLSRLIGLLDDDGYAVLRTPWPFLHERDPERSDRDTTERFADVRLTIEGAVGPETHAYGSTAVHLYMKAPRSPLPETDAGTGTGAPDPA